MRGFKAYLGGVVLVGITGLLGAVVFNDLYEDFYHLRKGRDNLQREIRELEDDKKWKEKEIRKEIEALEKEKDFKTRRVQSLGESEKRAWQEWQEGREQRYQREREFESKMKDKKKVVDSALLLVVNRTKEWENKRDRLEDEIHQFDTEIKKLKEEKKKLIDCNEGLEERLKEIKRLIRQGKNYRHGSIFRISSFPIGSPDVIPFDCWVVKNGRMTLDLD